MDRFRSNWVSRHFNGRTRIGVGAILLLLLGCDLAVPDWTQGQVGQWSSMGPYGGLVRTFAIDSSISPSTLYAGTNHGVFKSTDGGVSWSPFSDGPMGGTVPSLAVDTTTGPPATLYAGVAGGVFKSVGGSSWSVFSSGLQGLAVDSVAIDARTATVYAGTSSGVFKSVGGSPFSAFNSGLQDLAVQSLAIDTTTVPSSTLYATTSKGGVFKSADGSWSAFNDGLETLNTTQLAIDATKAPLVLYVESDNLVYRRTAADSSWSVVNRTQYLPDIYSLAVDSTKSPPTLYVGTLSGVFRSTDAMGLTGLWSEAGLGGVDGYYVIALAIDSATAPSPTLYAGTVNYGAFKTTNGGNSWSRVDIRIPMAVNAMVVDPSAASTLYAGTIFGLFKSADGGGSWSHLTEPPNVNIGLAHGNFTAVAIDTTSSPPTIYAAAESIYKSTDGGDRWSVVGGLGVVRSLAINAGNPSTIFAGDGRGVFRSRDGGTSWNKSNSSPSNIKSLVIHKTPTGSTVYAATSNGIFKSPDDGDSWNMVNDARAGSSVSLAIDAASSTLYAAGGGGVYKTTSGGNSWERIDSMQLMNKWMYVTSLVVDDSRTPSVLYAGTYHGVYMHKSSDSADSWALIDTAGMTNSSIEWLVLRSGDPSTLYAGTLQGALKRSWRDFDASLWLRTWVWLKRWLQRIADPCWLPGAGSYWLKKRCP